MLTYADVCSSQQAQDSGVRDRERGGNTHAFQKGTGAASLPSAEAGASTLRLEVLHLQQLQRRCARAFLKPPTAATEEPPTAASATEASPTAATEAPASELNFFFPFQSPAATESSRLLLRKGTRAASPPSDGSHRCCCCLVQKVCRFTSTNAQNLTQLESARWRRVEAPARAATEAPASAATEATHLLLREKGDKKMKKKKKQSSDKGSQ